MEAEASYEIFRKESDNTTVLVEAVKGIDQAQKRVNQLNQMGSGEHFIFDPVQASVIEPSEPGISKDPFAL
jgi:hypothetical protein